MKTTNKFYIVKGKGLQCNVRYFGIDPVALSMM